MPTESKNMMERAILMVNNEEKISKLPVVGRIQNHPCMHAAVMDRPGWTCL